MDTEEKKPAGAKRFLQFIDGASPIGKKLNDRVTLPLRLLNIFAVICTGIFFLAPFIFWAVQTLGVALGIASLCNVFLYLQILLARRCLRKMEPIFIFPKAYSTSRELSKILTALLLSLALMLIMPVVLGFVGSISLCRAIVRGFDFMQPVYDNSLDAIVAQVGIFFTTSALFSAVLIGPVVFQLLFSILLAIGRINQNTEPEENEENKDLPAHMY